MKKFNISSITNIFLLPVLVSGGFSCQNLLVEEPRSVAVENFYNTEEEVRTATNAIYSPLRAERAEQVAILDTHTDWGYGRGSRAQYNDFQGFNAANINATTVRWNAYYEAIRNANLVILNAPQGTDISQEAIQRYVAEARFLRALAYFDLVRNWGAVPLRTEAELGELHVGKGSFAQIYDLIISDLLDAEQNLPDTQAQIGRPTRFAAMTMLADVYLTLGQFEEARDRAAAVIESGRYALVPAQSPEDLQWDLFGPDISSSSEEIFYFKYAREVNQGNWLLWILNHPSTGLFNFGGAFAHYGLSTDPFYENWNEDDIRKGLWEPVQFGLGPNTIINGKYRDSQAISNRGAGNDIPVYRYAEVLLLYAEASSQASGGPSADAVAAVNQVRRRAFGLSPLLPAEVDVSEADFTAASFLDFILMERAYEFQFEGKRWLDLKRTGLAEEVILEAKGVTIAEKHYLWPIPFEELNLNQALDPVRDQNPGY
jgi:starch-binding outer membrane protein, SusD/RagB family